MTIEIAISILALVIALLSAVYARRAVREAEQANRIAHRAVEEAKQANRIAAHGRKLEIFNTFKKFHGDLLAVGESNFKEADAYRLINACDDAKFYFPESIAADLKKYGDATYELLIARDGAKRQEMFQGGATVAKNKEVFANKDRCDAIAKGLRERIEAELKLV